MQYLWIRLKKDRQWTNGKIRIAQEIVERVPITDLQDIIYYDFGVVVCKETFSSFELPKPDCKPFLPEELTEILKSDS